MHSWIVPVLIGVLPIWGVRTILRNLRIHHFVQTTLVAEPYKSDYWRYSAKLWHRDYPKTAHIVQADSIFTFNSRIRAGYKYFYKMQSTGLLTEKGIEAEKSTIGRI